VAGAAARAARRRRRARALRLIDEDAPIPKMPNFGCDGQFYTYKLYPPEFHLVRQIRYDDSGESLLFADT
jgi:hypothetical protein